MAHVCVLLLFSIVSFQAQARTFQFFGKTTRHDEASSPPTSNSRGYGLYSRESDFAKRVSADNAMYKVSASGASGNTLKDFDPLDEKNKEFVVSYEEEIPKSESNKPTSSPHSTQVQNSSSYNRETTPMDRSQEKYFSQQNYYSMDSNMDEVPYSVRTKNLDNNYYNLEEHPMMSNTETEQRGNSYWATASNLDQTYLNGRNVELARQGGSRGIGMSDTRKMAGGRYYYHVEPSMINRYKADYMEAVSRDQVNDEFTP